MRGIQSTWIGLFMPQVAKVPYTAETFGSAPKFDFSNALIRTATGHRARLATLAEKQAIAISLDYRFRNRTTAGLSPAQKQLAEQYPDARQAHAFIRHFKAYLRFNLIMAMNTHGVLAEAA